MELGITTSPTPERYTVHVAGEVDISNADALRTAIDLALEQPPAEVELDFSQVSYIDSTGIGVLVGAAHHARDHHWHERRLDSGTYERCVNNPQSCLGRPRAALLRGILLLACSHDAALRARSQVP